MTRSEIACAEDACRIRDRMDFVRSKMHCEVQGLKQGAGNLFSLKHQMKAHPWVGVGAAVAVGFLIGPSRRREPEFLLDEEAIQKIADRGGIKVEPRTAKRSSMTGSASKLIANAVVRAAIAYAGQQLGKVSGVKAAEESESR